MQAALIFFAFGRWAVVQHIDYASLPLLVKFHGIVFGGWVLLYVGQTWLAATGRFGLHRPMGWVSVAVAAAVVVLGPLVAAGALQRGAVPPGFSPAIFLVLNDLQLLFFAALVALAIILRRRSEWHKRLMFAAATTFVFPAFGRILPMPLFGPFALWALVGAGLLFLVAGMVNDIFSRGRIHPAYVVGIGSHLAATAAMEPLAATPLVIGYASALMH